MIKIKNLTKTFGVQNSLDNISLELNKGDSVIIMGQNGAGKTTLIRSILGQYIPSSGTIEVAGNNPFKNRVDTISKVGFVPQLPPPIKLTVEELINFAIHSSNISKKSVVELCLKMDLDLVIVLVFNKSSSYELMDITFLVAFLDITFLVILPTNGSLFIILLYWFVFY